MTALNSAESRLTGFELGADEYLPKPFHLKEFLLRVRHVLTTQPPRRAAAGRRRDDRLGRDGDRSSAGGERAFLQVRDFQRACACSSKPRRARCRRSEILDRVWGEQEFPTQRTVDNAIVRLRQALGDDRGAVDPVGQGYWVSMGGQLEVMNRVSARAGRRAAARAADLADAPGRPLSPSVPGAAPAASVSRSCAA